MRSLRSSLCLAVFVLILASPSIASRSLSVAAQGNTISGTVYGLEGRRLSDIYVELLDGLYRTIRRTRTDGSGSYTFTGIGADNVTVRVTPFNTMYLEQEASIEIKSPFTMTGGGGYADYHKDFFLKLRKGVDPAAVAIFVQDVPREAKSLYEDALAHLVKKRNKEAQAALRSAIEIFPRYYYALALLGTEYIRMNLPEGYQAAEILLANAVEVNPRAHESWYGLAYSLYVQRKVAPALMAIQKAIELNAMAADAQMLYGVISRERKSFEDAEKALLKANELSGGRIARVHWELALLYGNDLKRYADAARTLKEYLKAADGSVNTTNVKKLIADFEAKAKSP